jgi:hypothetical protein
MADLGDVATLNESQKETEVQLTLENRFKDQTKSIIGKLLEKIDFKI